jgi:diadenosine tetraphosphate (Ap4A) HIT family hydrolase
MSCVLCDEIGGLLVCESEQWRVIRAEDVNFPAFYRLIWKRHVAEFSDLGLEERTQCMSAVVKIETVLRKALNPTKINLATLGNVVPHLHWHVIARFEWDSHFPNPVWGEAKREVPDAEGRLGITLAELDSRVSQALLL